MQISAIEVTKLLTSEKVKPGKADKAGLKFVSITPDSLPKTVEPSKEEVAEVTKMVAQAPDVREDIVMRLKEQIDKGEYKVSGEEIAEMMIRRMKADNIR